MNNRNIKLLLLHRLVLTNNINDMEFGIWRNPPPHLHAVDFRPAIAPQLKLPLVALHVFCNPDLAHLKTVNATNSLKYTVK